ncbi:MAG TPA: RlmE family RNA methyltransferase [Candidatus Bathyarchaeia archaeon]|nr:RlmE family RNA methyltransferase [Candidatus Bathyarchaeia archaeon]
MKGLQKQRKDYYYRRAKSEGYRSRAAFKLLEIQEQYRIIRRGDVVVDLGAAPGGWLQVISQLGGAALAIDLQQITPLPGITFIRGDLTSPEIVTKIRNTAVSVDVVVSDAAPNLSGTWSLDHARSIELSARALEIAKCVLKPGGNFVVKVFQGDLLDTFVRDVTACFRFVKAFNPQASRKQSAETYIIAKRYAPANAEARQAISDCIGGAKFKRSS